MAPHLLTRSDANSVWNSVFLCGTEPDLRPLGRIGPRCNRGCRLQARLSVEHYIGGTTFLESVLRHVFSVCPDISIFFWKCGTCLPYPEYWFLGFRWKSWCTPSRLAWCGQASTNTSGIMLPNGNKSAALRLFRILKGKSSCCDFNPNSQKLRS